MYSIALKEAKNQLEELTAKVVTGEEVIITDDKGAAFQLIQIIPKGHKFRLSRQAAQLSFNPKKPQPRFGSAKGLISMAEDFNEPLDDFKDYMREPKCGHKQNA